MIRINSTHDKVSDEHESLLKPFLRFYWVLLLFQHFNTYGKEKNKEKKKKNNTHTKLFVCFILLI